MPRICGLRRHPPVGLLVNAGRSKDFRALKKHIRLLEARFGDEIKDIFGIHIPALTANEASYLVGFRAADEIRKIKGVRSKLTAIIVKMLKKVRDN